MDELNVLGFMVAGLLGLAIGFVAGCVMGYRIRRDEENTAIQRSMEHRQGFGWPAGRA
jgi:hypothetical protein